MKKIYFYAIFIASISTSYAQSCQDCFITTWNTEAGDSGSTSFKLPIVSGAYDVDINNDGDFDDDNEANRTGIITIDFGTGNAGTKTIQVRPNPTNNTAGELEIDHNASGSTPQKLTSIDKWGTIVWKSTRGGRNFLGCSNLTIATDAGAPNLTAVTSTHAMFANCTNLTGDLSGWNVSNVTDASVMFAATTSFTSDLSSWNVSKVINTRAMFRDASSFNSVLSSWNVSGVTDMNEMFEGNSSFTSDLSSWDVSNVKNMKDMFLGASNFTSDLGSWNVSKVANMTNMFRLASSFTNEHYEALLTGWSNLILKMNVPFKAPPVDYCRYGKAERETIVNTYNWTITGDYCPFIFTIDTRLGVNNKSVLINVLGGAYDVDIGNNGYESNRRNRTATWYIGTNVLPAGVYTIAIRPNDANNPNHQLSMQPYDHFGDGEKITEIVQWGSISWASLGSIYSNCPNLTIAENAGAPNLTRATNINNAFNGCTNLTGDFSGWDVSKVTQMANTFKGATNFNSDLSSWNVSNVTNMEGAFSGATSFNSDLSSWNVSKVANMTNMLTGATSFSSENYDALLTGWSALPTLQSGVTFGAPPKDYCTGKAGRDILTGTPHSWSISGDGASCPIDPLILTFDTTREQPATGQTVYIPITGGSYDIDTDNDGIYDDLNKTNVIKEYLFDDPGIYTIRIRPNSTHNPDNQLAINFDENSGEASSFAPTLTRVDKWGDIVWTSMERAFTSCTHLTIAEDAGVPNLTMVTSMKSMFASTSINSDISTWDVSNVTDMSRMFLYSTNFNSDLGSWNVSNVVDMGYMFYQASSFDADISTWDVSNVSNMTGMFNADDPNAMSFSDYNYEKLLAGWSSLPTLQSGVAFTAPPASYCKGGTGRSKLTNAVADGGYGWTITGDSMSTNCSDLALSIDAFLQGPYDTTTSKMNASLLTANDGANIIPAASPYGDGSTVLSTVFDATGDDAIVDWVQVSLHNPNDARIVISSTPAFLQRDGDVVNLSGGSFVVSGVVGDYKVSINHRNHIPVITDAAQSLSTTETAIDFTNDLTIVTGGSNAMAEVATGIYALFSGDVNQNGQVQVDDYNAAIQDVGKGGYLTSDVDMNGELQVSDINFVLKTLGKGAQF